MINRKEGIKGKGKGGKGAEITGDLGGPQSPTCTDGEEGKGGGNGRHAREKR